MWSYAVVAGIGAIIANRSKPKSQCVKSVAYGPRSGLYWDVEEFPEAGVLILRSQIDPTVCTFRKGPRGHVLVSQRGSPSVVQAMCRDFLPQLAKKKGPTND